MAKTKTFNSYLNGVTSVNALDTSDRLMAMTNAGVPKKITRTNMVYQDSRVTATIPAGEPRWLRIAEFKSYGAGCLLGVGASGFNSGSCFPVVMMVSARHGSSVNTHGIKCLSPNITGNGTSSVYPFTKIRITGTENHSYVDVWVNTTSARSLNLEVNLSMGVSSYLVNPIIENPTEGQNIKEFTIEEVLFLGGVICLVSNSYKFFQKGGVLLDGKDEDNLFLSEWSRKAGFSYRSKKIGIGCCRQSEGQLLRSDTSMYSLYGCRQSSSRMGENLFKDSESARGENREWRVSSIPILRYNGSNSVICPLVDGGDLHTETELRRYKQWSMEQLEAVCFCLQLGRNLMRKEVVA